MNNRENQIYTWLAQYVRAAHPNVFVFSSFERKPTQFPALMLYEADCTIADRYQPSPSSPNFYDSMWEAQVFSNNQSGGKRECKQIMNTLSEGMNQLGFVQMTNRPLENLDELTITRRLARWKGVYNDTNIYRR